MLRYKKYIFIFKTLELGGIETLIIRLSNYLVKEGYDVTFITCKPGNLTPLFDERVKIKFCGTLYYFLVNPFISKKILSEFSGLNDDLCIMSFNPQSNFIGMGLAQALKPGGYITGIYHPEAYTRLNTSPNRKLFLSSILSLSPLNILAMNQEVVGQLKKNGYKKATYIDLVPLPINSQEPFGINYSDPLRIVSVGRFVDFKVYPIGMIKALRALKDLGINFQYDIYGWGPLEDKIKKEIVLSGLEENISLIGKLDYSELSKVLSNYNYFWGMGTASVEAASIGLPSLVAIINREDHTYGYLFDQKDFCVGEETEELDALLLDDVLKDATCPDKRRQYGQRCKLYSQRFNIENICVKMFSKSRPLSLSDSQKCIGFIMYFLVSFLSNFIMKIKKQN